MIDKEYKTGVEVGQGNQCESGEARRGFRSAREWDGSWMAAPYGLRLPVAQRNRTLFVDSGPHLSNASALLGSDERSVNFLFD